MNQSTCYVFDFDSTIAKTSALHYIINSYEATVRSRPLPLLSFMQNLQGSIYILTARPLSQKGRKSIHEFLLMNGIHIPSQNIVMVGSSGISKCYGMKHILEREYYRCSRFYFFDDLMVNIKAINKCYPFVKTLYVRRK